MENTNNFVIDVDKAVDTYNEQNPELRKLDRKELAGKIGMNPQIFSDWKNGKTPKLVQRLFAIAEITGCDIKEFIIKDEENGK